MRWKFDQTFLPHVFIVCNCFNGARGAEDSERSYKWSTFASLTRFISWSELLQFKSCCNCCEIVCSFAKQSLPIASRFLETYLSFQVFCFIVICDQSLQIIFFQWMILVKVFLKHWLSFLQEPWFYREFTSLQYSFWLSEFSFDDHINFWTNYDENMFLWKEI